MLHELACVSARVLAYRLFGAPVCPRLASSWSCPCIAYFDHPFEENHDKKEREAKSIFFERMC
jgi:hypothetical protein